VEPGPPAVDPRAPSAELSLSAWDVLALAAWFGLAGGALDLAMIFVRRDVFHTSLYYEQGKNFRWVVPLANLAVIMAPGLVLAVVSRLRPGIVSPRATAWALATFAVWGPLLRLPLFGAATMLLAAGIGRALSRWFADRYSGLQRVARYSLPVLLILLAAIWAISYRQQTRAEIQALARLPAPPAGGSNVLLIVMDTVRAQSMGLYGYARDTTPRLSRWAKRGIRFDQALAPAPWTLPSHCSLMTGQWPSRLGAHWLPTLDPAYPTLAQFFAAHGYLTSGFAANTYWCSYESGMDRGFAHYEDYRLTPRTILGSTLPGQWVLETLSRYVDISNAKWIRAQSRDAGSINKSFLDWLTRERHRQRPFFAFLNYFDAHEPFLPAKEADGPFAQRPQSSSDYRVLLDFMNCDKLKLSEREVQLAQDSYDDCIVALDQQVGALLDALDARGVLQDTIVMITSDHGEQFGEHGVFNHGYSLYSQEVRVPLLIIWNGAPAGLSIPEPVSLRDLPATAVDLTQLGSGSPFPGRSLAECWREKPGAKKDRVSQAASEVDIPVVIGPERGRGPTQRRFTMSLVVESFHYLVDIAGTEELYDLTNDPREVQNLKNEPDKKQTLDRCRLALAEFLRDNRVRSGAAADYQQQLMKLLGDWLPQPPI
jgi:arylsulfatase A-like enzyme